MNSSEYLRQTKELVTSIQTRFLELGGRLFNIREKGLWKDFYDSYSDFLQDIDVTESQASIFSTIHEVFKLKGGFKDETLSKIGYSKLYSVIPLIEKNGIDLALSKALTLPRDEIQDEIRLMKHGEHKCVLEAERFAFCQTCHKLKRVGNEEKTI